MAFEVPALFFILDFSHFPFQVTFKRSLQTPKGYTELSGSVPIMVNLDIFVIIKDFSTSVHKSKVNQNSAKILLSLNHVVTHFLCKMQRNLCS